MNQLHVEQESHEDVGPMIVEQARRADQKLVAFVRDRPLAAMAAAVAVGYLIGRVFSRVG